MTRHLISLFLAFCVSAGAFAQQTKILSADRHNEYGLVYSLPDTQLKITFTVEKSVKKRGPFYQYAKKYIGTGNVVTEDCESWRIIDVKVSALGVADMKTQYMMRFKAGLPGYICVAQDNMLLAINANVDDNTDYSVSDRQLTLIKEGIDPEAFLQYMGEDYLASQSLAKKAQYLSESMLEIRDSRNALTRGTADNMPTDGKQLELMLSNMQQQETAMMVAFSGSETVWRGEYTYFYTPENEGEHTIFRMSDFAGPVDCDNYAGSEVIMDIEITDRPTIPVDAKGEEKKLPKDAVIYNIPARASVSITHKGSTLYHNPDLRLAQFGIQFGLDPTIFTDKKDPAFVTFDPATGSIIKKGPANSQNLISE